MVIEYPLVLAGANLAATVVYASLPVPCRGAHTVAFHISASNSVVPGAAYAIEARKSGLGLTTDGAWITVGASTPGIAATVQTPADLSAGGQMCFATGVASATSVPTVIPGWDEVRIKVTGHATLTINSLRIRAQAVMPDSGFTVDPSITATSTT